MEVHRQRNYSSRCVGRLTFLLGMFGKLSTSLSSSSLYGMVELVLDSSVSVGASTESSFTSLPQFT